MEKLSRQVRSVSGEKKVLLLGPFSFPKTGKCRHVFFCLCIMPALSWGTERERALPALNHDWEGHAFNKLLPGDHLK